MSHAAFWLNPYFFAGKAYVAFYMVLPFFVFIQDYFTISYRKTKIIMLSSKKTSTLLLCDY